MPDTAHRPPLRLVVMGVSGSGKSTLAAAIAAAIGCPLIEGDDLHPPANRVKMAAGVALDDGDREPWLDALARAIAAAEGDVVATCSALKRRYRDRLRAQVPAARFVCIAITPDQAEARVASRAGHYFPAQLVATQFAAFESPDAEVDVVMVPATWRTERQVAAALQGWTRGH